MSKVKNYYWNEDEKDSYVIIEDYFKGNIVASIMEDSFRQNTKYSIIRF